MEGNKYLAINWTDGVKINKDHFFESYYNTIENMKNYTKLNLSTYNYGLLDKYLGMKDSVNLEPIIQTDERITLQLRSCHGITQNGFKIEYTPELYGEEYPTETLESNSFDKNEILSFYVIVVVNPFKMKPIGEPDPEVIPLHHPYTLPEIKLKIVSKDQFSTNFLQTYYLKVGEIQWKNGAFILDNEYVPPTTKVIYNEKLTDFHKKILDTLFNVKNNIVIINRKNISKYSTNKLAGNTYKLCKSTLDFISNNRYEITQIDKEKPPIYLINKLIILANNLITELVMMDKVEKENLLQYYYEWIDIKPSQFESTLGQLMESEYDHLKINDSILKVNEMLDMLSLLFRKLSDLEYIGQRKDNIVVSEDTKVTQKTQENSWSIID